MGKVLYFEGAGCVPRGDVENCRVRTAFHTDDGKAIYLELTGLEVHKNSSPSLMQFINAGLVDACFYITGGRDDENYNKVRLRNWDDSAHFSFEYTKAEILKLVNWLGCSFDDVVILPDLAGYRVHKDGGGYNFGDEFLFDETLTARREAIRQHYYDLEKSEGKKYPNFSIWVDAENAKLLHVLRHFNGFNRHWLIDATSDDWQSTMLQTALNSPGRYGVAPAEA